MRSPDNAIIDWIMVELRDPLYPEHVLAFTAAALQRDGQIVSGSGSPIIRFEELPEEYYIVAVRHRNHIGVITAQPVYLSSGSVPMVDFTDPSLALMGGAGAAHLVKGKRMLWAGDFNGDGKIIFQGPDNDVIYLFSKVMSAGANVQNLANFIVNSYETEDLNLDGKVIYQGPNNDKTSLLYNSVLAHPGNAGMLANYIVKGMMP